MAETIQGIIHGRTIELSADPGLGDGKVVEVLVRVVEPTEGWGEGIRRSAGAMAKHWTEEDDRILQALHQERRLDDRTELDG